MKRGVVFNILIILSLIISLNFVMAEFSIGDPSHSIEKIYGAKSSIKGWINISLDDEPGTSLFEDSEGNTISLLNLLKKSTSHTYSCNPLNCETDYSSSNAESSKTTTLNSGATKVYGLSLTGNIQSVESLNFNIESNAPVSTRSQIRIDVFDNGKIDFLNNKVCSGNNCANVKSHGCWLNGPIQEEYDAESGVPFCQKINLSESPGFSLGAWIKKISGTMTFEASLYDSIGNQVAKCTLPEVTNTTGTEISCNIDYVVKEQDTYYACFYPTSGSGSFRFRGYSVTNGCGFRHFPTSQNAPAAYDLFAESKRFASPETIQISNSLQDGTTLSGEVQSYIQNKYGGLDCSTECVVPIRITSTANQQITLKDLSLRYRKDGSVTTQSNFYDLAEMPAEISADFQKILLEGAKFTVPGDLGIHDFSLEFNGDEIFEEEINVSDIPQVIALSPAATAAAYPTTFRVRVSSPTLAKRYLWDFGDNQTQITSTNQVTHTYPVIGTYQLTVTVTDASNLGNSRTFEVNVSSPKDLINLTIIKLRNNIEVLGLQMNGFTQDVREALESTLNLDNASIEISRLEQNFNNATSESQYNQIITDLLKLNIPSSVSEGSIAESISFFPDTQAMDISVLQSIAGGTYDSDKEEGYRGGVIFWNQQNLDTKVDYKEIVGEYDNSVETVVKVFTIKISEKTDVAENYFFIMRKIDNLEFSPGTITNDAGDYLYIDLQRSSGLVSFSTTQEFIDFTNIPGFISPGVNSLSIVDIVLPEEKDSRLTIFILAISFLVIVGFIVYIFLQQWYKKRYEDYLFKNKNDLYNMVTYVNHAKKRGLKKSEIEAHLKKARWGSEQIRYVMKKYAGKRTGMVEIPFTDFISEKIEKK